MTAHVDLPPATVAFAQRCEGWADKRSPQARALWAKSGDETGHLTLPQHLVDSACTAAAVYDTWLAPQLKNTLANKTPLTETELRSLVLFVAGTHDVGKACKTFQTQLDGRDGFAHLITNLDDAGLPRGQSSSELMHAMPHGLVSASIIQSWLEEKGFSHDSASHLAEVAGAHHGIASPREETDAIRTILADYEPPWRAIHLELLEEMEVLTGAAGALEKLRTGCELTAAVLQILTGLVVLADWIASNADAFPMGARGAQSERLLRGMEVTDLTAPWAPPLPGADMSEFFRRSFGWPADYAPRSIQSALVEAAGAVDGPALFILEAGTGEGKTEAALAAAQVLAHSQQAHGVYLAAPTMATANGLLERTIAWAAHTTGDGSVSSLYLAHSKNQLSAPFQRLKLRDIDPGPAGSRGSVVASSWMSGRRRGLLSNIAVGTVDQVLMMALQQRYSMLRHVALAGKVVIFDEVHSFDTYTSQYLETTLEWLAYYGASVIVMSATLPRERREALIEAYTGARPEASHDGYPLITVATEEQVDYLAPQPPATDLCARVTLLDDALPALTTRLRELVGDGGCALVICNTIARAQDAYRALDDAFPGEVELHHAGFVASERNAREDVLRRALGPGARRGSGRPDRLIVVATQVAEQSLDIDADVLVTDIAPMDLVIQRIGRLHRHRRPAGERPGGLERAQVFVRGVEDMQPYPVVDSGAEAVYGARLLLATLLHLPGTFRRPDDVAELVQAVYREEQDVPREWADVWSAAVREDEERQAQAHKRSKSYRIPTPFQRQPLEKLFAAQASAALSLADEERGAAQVRDAEPTVEVIVIVTDGEGYRTLDGQHHIDRSAELTYQQAFALASSTVRLPARMTRWDSDFNAVVDTLETLTPPHWQQHYLLKGQLALPLEEDGTLPVGRFRVAYSRELGLECTAEKEGGVSDP